jgi:hypothetical protein
MICVAPRDWLEPQQRAILDACPRVSVPSDIDSQHLYERFMINLEYPAFRVKPLAGPNHHQLPCQLEERLTQANGHPDLSLVQPYAIGVVLRLVDLFDEVEKRVIDIMKAGSKGMMLNKMWPSSFCRRVSLLLLHMAYSTKAYEHLRSRS